jgi:uncharacterized protein (DUF2062 family)
MSQETPDPHAGARGSGARELGVREVPWWSRIVARLAALGESPARTAAAFALGVFLSFSPFLGLQIAIGMAAAVGLRLSKIAVFVGLNANLPWIMIPWYVLTTAGAASLLGLPGAADMGDRLGQVFEQPFYKVAFWRRAVDLLGPYVWSFLIGPTTGAIVVGIGAYFLMHRMLASYPPTLRVPQGRPE